MFKRFFLRDLMYILKFRIFRIQPYNKREKNKGLKYIIIGILMLMMVWSFSFFETKIKPTVSALSEARAKVIAIRSINEAVNEEIVKKVKYEDLIFLRKDTDNRVTALQTNVVKMNEMQALTSQVIQDKLTNTDSSQLTIPIGNIMNSSILAGWGPRVKIKIMPVGTVQSEFKSTFVTAGINQTKHRIVMEVKGRVVVVVPLISTYTEVVTTVPIAETIIVGNVPQTYLDVTGASSEEQQKAREIAPNMATMGN